MSDATIIDAFHAVCTSAVTALPDAPRRFFVVLWREEQFYGGPEEGGWYGWDHLVEAYQEFPNEREAEAAAKAVEEMAKKMTEESQRERNAGALAALEWCDERGIDADGPDDAFFTMGDRFSVAVEDRMPENEYADRHWC